MIEIRDNRAYWCGTQVDLTVGEFKVLSCLVDQAGADLTYRQLYDAVRGKGFAAGYRENVRNFITRIRAKFRDVDPEFDGIENYDSFGYRWRRVEAPHVLREVA